MTSSETARAAESTANPPPALIVRGVSKSFGPVQALDGLDLTVASGTLVAVLGPNGAGKTTAVEMCEGLRRPDAGTISVLGVDPWRQAAALRPRIGVMLQAGGAQAAATPRQMLGLVARLAAHPHHIRWLLDVVGLTDAADTPVRRLSGGQVQRLGLAMALVGRPELLFLDEPSAGLDPEGRRLIWDLLCAARSDGVTILLTTHLLDEAEMLADRIVVIDRGRAVAEGTPAELMRTEDAALSFGAPTGLDLQPLLTALPEGFTAVETTPGQYRVTGDVRPATAATVASFCARAGVMPDGLRAGSRTLEEFYLELVGGRQAEAAR